MKIIYNGFHLFQVYSFMFLVNYLPKIVKWRKITSKYLKIDISVLLQLQMPQHLAFSDVAADYLKVST